MAKNTNTSSDLDYDIIQIGYGPVSKFAAHLFSRMGWRVGVFERFAEVYPLPRAVCIDHEIFRVFHACGLGELADRVCSEAPVYRWFNAEWKQLLSIDWAAGSVSGGAEVNFVHQPTFEVELDKLLKKNANVDLHFSSEATGIDQADEHVTVTVRDTKTGADKSYAARYLLGIDGANSFVREAHKIGRHDLGFQADWLVIDFALNNGLTARDLGIPECGQFANPVRPTTIVPGGIDAQGRVCRRWEFMRLPHETAEEMNQESKVWELLKAWIKPDQGELVRHTVYSFRSLVAETFQKGRVFLAGDAAHVMPPFMGQGMCAGLRDIWNLAWKLDRVMKGQAEAALLETYTPERAPHVTDIIKISMFLGSIICMPDKEDARKRDEMFLGGQAPKPAPFPKLTDGMLRRGKASQVLDPGGLLSCAGTVRFRNKTGRFDSFVPVGHFVLIISNTAKCSAEVLRLCEANKILVFTVADRASAQFEEIGDTQGQFGRYMGENKIFAMLIRPDFYLFGGAENAEDIDGLVKSFVEQSRGYRLAG
jgi:2-polyprenyl-6-methoxyphenol hydroxylase-like FAD-dependent oxidoreductase